METQWMKEDKSTFNLLKFLGMEEQSTVKIPTNWGCACLDPTHMHVFTTSGSFILFFISNNNNKLSTQIFQTFKYNNINLGPVWFDIDQLIYTKIEKGK